MTHIIIVIVICYITYENSFMTRGCMIGFTGGAEAHLPYGLVTLVGCNLNARPVPDAEYTHSGTQQDILQTQTTP